jgi:hypothetical protein
MTARAEHVVSVVTNPQGRRCGLVRAVPLLSDRSEA